MLIFFNHFPKTGGINFFNNYIFGNELTILLDQEKYNKNIVLYQLYHEIRNKNNFLYYHNWLPQNNDLYCKEKELNLKYDFAFCFIRNPIEIFYSAFFWIKNEMKMDLNYAFAEFERLNYNHDKLECPCELIDMIEWYYKEIDIKMLFPNNLFIFNDFSKYDLILDYADYEKNVCLLASEFKLQRREEIIYYNKIYKSYGMTKKIDMSYKLNFVKKFLHPSLVVYEELKDKINKCGKQQFFITPNSC